MDDQHEIRRAHNIQSNDWSADATQARRMTEAVRIVWIDNHRLTRDCMISAFTTLHPPLLPAPFESVDDYVGRLSPKAVDLVVYYAHQLGTTICDDIAALKQAVDQRPIVLLSDTSEAESLDVIRSVLRSGANGFVSTRTSSLSMALAALLFVQAGGTFAPLELLLSEDAAPQPAKEQTSGERLTARQMNVLAQVRQGKANKTIARDLGMSESAVKVHIRSIMRKMGAANRTQAAFAALDRQHDDDETAGDDSPAGAALPPQSRPLDEQNGGRDV